MWATMVAGGGRPWCQYDSNRASLSGCPISWSREIASGMPIKLPGTWIALSSKSKVTDLQADCAQHVVNECILASSLIQDRLCDGTVGLHHDRSPRPQRGPPSHRRGWMKCCLMSSDVSWHIRDKLWPMPKHGSIILYVHGNQKAR